MKKLPQSFFMQDTISVAKQLLGKYLVFNDIIGIINETEAYIGQDDPACHAAKGKTKRNEAMFLEGGHSYVYLIYGMYYCFNIVTEAKDFPAAVLIRGLFLPKENILLDGPGKICKNLGITKEQNSLKLTDNDYFYFGENYKKNIIFEATPRIGISKGKDKLWRFIIKKEK